MKVVNHKYNNHRINSRGTSFQIDLKLNMNNNNNTMMEALFNQGNSIASINHFIARLIQVLSSPTWDQEKPIH